MHLKKVAIKKFRLLKDVELLLEAGTTVIVGRNNSGKTSLTEVMRRLLSESAAYFGECDRSFRRIVTGGLSDVLSAVSVT